MLDNNEKKNVNETKKNIAYKNVEHKQEIKQDTMFNLELIQ